VTIAEEAGMAGEKILVVEDNDANMLLTTDILEVSGYVVVQAESAEQAIAMARAEAPALILMDIALPGMDGLAAAGLLKADEAARRIPIVALTAYAMKGDRERILAAGCDGYVTKPFEIAEFLKTVAEFVGKK
jgi:CheY-like chemotaxis protein